MKKALTIILFALLVFSATGCGNKINEEEYLSAASNFVENVTESSTIVSNYGNYIFQYWKTLTSFNKNAPGIKSEFDLESAIEKANQYLEEKSNNTRESMDGAYADIKEMYTKFDTISTSNVEIITINDKIQTLYNDYCELYELATNPIGETAKEYSEKFVDLVKTVDTECENLTEALNAKE